MAESNVDDQFIFVIKLQQENTIKCNRPIISHHFSHMHTTFWLGIEQCFNGAGIRYQMKPVPDLHDTHTRKSHRKNGVNFCCQFLECLSWVLVLEREREEKDRGSKESLEGRGNGREGRWMGRIFKRAGR